MRPNVLLVVLDAARRDSLEPYGAAPGSSPTVAQVASRGTALEHVYATGSWTLPSHSSMFTGLLPRAAGLVQGASPQAVRPVFEGHRDRVLAEVMRRAGYRTAAVSANLWVSRESGFGAGFDEFVQVDTGRHAKLHAASPRERLRWDLEALRGRVDDGAANAAAVLERWISAPPAGPFFWFVNLIECHSPYLPPRPYGDTGVIARLRAAEDARRYYRLNVIWSTCAGVTRVPEATLARVRRMYAGAIRYMDDWLGRVLERMDASGLLDDTLVVVTSDHGENLGEGGLTAHAFSLDNRLLNVPLVLMGPGAAKASIDSLADLPRLVAESVELDGHPWRDGPPAGFGVAQFDPPTAPDEATLRRVERLPPPARIALTTPLTCAVADDLKLLRRGDREEVFDLATDPAEARPLDPVAVAADGRGAQLAALRAALDHPAVSSRAPEAAPAATASDAETRDLEERMRLLGYM